MPWYFIAAILYVALLLVAILFIAGATRLAKEAEANGRMMPLRKPMLHGRQIRANHREAA